MSVSKARKKMLNGFTKKSDYKIEDAVREMKELSYVKFNESVDVAVILSTNKKSSDQHLKGVAVLPHANGVSRRILAICSSGHEKECLDAGADFAGGDDYLKKIEGGWFDFDVIVTVPAMMLRISKLGRILGPKGLMPNPETGGVSENIVKSIEEIKKGRVELKVNKDGTMHCCIGKLSFGVDKLVENFKSYVLAVKDMLKNRSNNIKKISVSSTMGVSFKIDY